MSAHGIWCRIWDERRRQDRLYGAYNPTISENEMMVILVEEIGEVARALQGGPDAGDVDEELVQSAAVIVRWLQIRQKRGVSSLPCKECYPIEEVVS